MFRKVMNPTPIELRARLRLQCSLFFFAGHGRLDGGKYAFELRGEHVPIEDYEKDVGNSKATVLFFDSCDSGLSDGWGSAPRVFERLPYAYCLIGMQGPAEDRMSRAFVPQCVESLLLGMTAWSAVDVVRRSVAEHGDDYWFLPVVHIKENYRPFQV